MKTLNQLFLLAILICLSVNSIVAQPKIILKLDDLTARNGTSKFITVLDYLNEKNIKAGFGAVGNGFDNSSLAVLTPYINATNKNDEKLFEIWNHGWDHIEPEFKGTPYAYQKAHFEQTNSAILNYLGIQMQTFGPTFNKSDETTYRVVSENPNYKIFLFTSAVIPELTSLQNRVDMENGVGNPEYNYFVDRYNSNSSLPYMILQGHPAMWDAAKLEQFKQIVEFLISENCEFVNAYEMANNECTEESAPQTPPGFSAVATATRQISLNWEATEEYKRSYIIERKQEDDEYSVISYPYRTDTSYIDNDVVDGYTYSYRMVAFNCFGCSPYSQEIEVFLEKDQTELLLVKSVSASSFLGNYKPENVIDNNLNTYWLIEGENHWLQLELNENALLCRVNIGFVKGKEKDYQFAIETSMDGIEWTRSGSFKSSGTSTDYEEFNFDAVEARFLRYITGLNSVDEMTWLAEIQLRGKISTSTRGMINPELFKVSHSHQQNALLIEFNDGQIHNATVSVYDLPGRRMEHERISGSSHVFYVQNLKPGIYLFKLEYQKMVSVQKIWIGI